METNHCDCCWLLYWDDPDEGLSSGIVKLSKEHYANTDLMMPIMMPNQVIVTVHKEELREPTEAEVDKFEGEWETTVRGEFRAPTNEPLGFADALASFLTSMDDQDLKEN